MGGAVNRDDIIRMAWEAGFIEGMSWGYEVWEANPASLERFAALVAAAEREACAKLMYDKFDFCGDELTAAAAIRSRGEVKP